MCAVIGDMRRPKASSPLCALLLFVAASASAAALLGDAASSQHLGDAKTAASWPRKEKKCHGWGAVTTKRVYAFTVSSNYFSGLAVVMYSVHRARLRHRGGHRESASFNDTGYLLLWSRLEPDSILSAERTELLVRLVAPTPIFWREVPAPRLLDWSRKRGLTSGPGQYSTFFRLDLFTSWNDETCADVPAGSLRSVMYLDSDMLILPNAPSLDELHDRIWDAQRTSGTHYTNSGTHHRSPLHTAERPSWVMHASVNYFLGHAIAGILGTKMPSKLASVDTTGMANFQALNVNFQPNAGFLAFCSPAPPEFTNAVNASAQGTDQYMMWNAVKLLDGHWKVGAHSPFHRPI